MDPNNTLVIPTQATFFEDRFPRKGKDSNKQNIETNDLAPVLPINNRQIPRGNSPVSIAGGRQLNRGGTRSPAQQLGHPNQGGDTDNDSSSSSDSSGPKLESPASGKWLESSLRSASPRSNSRSRSRSRSRSLDRPNADDDLRRSRWRSVDRLRDQLRELDEVRPRNTKEVFQRFTEELDRKTPIRDILDRNPLPGSSVDVQGVFDRIPLPPSLVDNLPPTQVDPDNEIEYMRRMQRNRSGKLRERSRRPSRSPPRNTPRNRDRNPRVNDPALPINRIREPEENCPRRSERVPRQNIRPDNAYGDKNPIAIEKEIKEKRDVMRQVIEEMTGKEGNKLPTTWIPENRRSDNLDKTMRDANALFSEIKALSSHLKIAKGNHAARILREQGNEFVHQLLAAMVPMDTTPYDYKDVFKHKSR